MVPTQPTPSLANQQNTTIPEELKKIIINNCGSCPLYFTPVCGVNDKKDAKLFTNECVMQYENCRDTTSKFIV